MGSDFNQLQAIGDFRRRDFRSGVRIGSQNGSETILTENRRVARLILGALVATLAWLILPELAVAAAAETGSAGEISDLRTTIFTKAYAVVVSVTVAMIVLCVIFHFEILTLLSRLLPRLRTQRRKRILVLMLSLIAAHVIEIWIFGIGYTLLLQDPAHGGLTGWPGMWLPDYIYYSAVVYTTLGFGDITPHGAIRFLTGTEALAGFLLITWSASFTFIEMQRFWHTD